MTLYLFYGDSSTALKLIARFYGIVFAEGFILDDIELGTESSALS